ncbi:hypothetical protein [Anaplasma capra]|uniref:hypothetical protein n=1 Tax=Anaplasma capra TaxID=1562740 RepID=UPI0021D5CC87|nr:hypothetical protein [Anaplasma capra]MCU7611115.1 hypothetical protein [Anaplasma capra]MCU7612381.1 hypothetical protein [Anaplasma capra]
MKAEHCGWMGIFCILSLWMGGVSYFVLDFREVMLNSAASIERLVREHALMSETLSGISSETKQLKGLIPNKSTIVVNRDGCVRAECLAKVLLMIADLRRAFALGAMSHDAIHAVKPILVELNDQQISDNFKVVEEFRPNRGYRDLVEELLGIRKRLRTAVSGPIGRYLSKWISIENHNETVWREFERLERLASLGAWEDCLSVANDDSLNSIPGMKSWIKDLESMLKIERSLSAIYDRLIERVNSNPEGI